MTRLLILVVALFAVFAPVPAMAATAPHVSTTEQGIAIVGYDRVAFFTLGKPQPGMAAHSYDYQGATWRFATAETLPPSDEGEADLPPLEADDGARR